MIKFSLSLFICFLIVSTLLSAKAETSSVPQEAVDNYATYCSACHGEQGNGNGPLANALELTPTPHQHSEYIRGLTDEYLVTLLRNGGPAVGKSELMAPWKGTLSDQQINELVAYLKELAQQP